MRTLFQAVRITISKRPLCFACGLFLAVLFAAVYCEWRYALIAGLGLLAVAIGLTVIRFLRSRKQSFGLTLAAAALFSASIALIVAHGAVDFGYHRKVDSLDGQSGQAVITVTRPKSVTVYSTACEGRLLTLDGKEIGLDGIFYLPYEAALQTGDRLTAEVSISPIYEADSDLTGRYSLSQGLYFSAEIIGDSHTVLGKEDIFPYSLTSSVKNTISGILKRYLPSDACGLASALLIGDRSALSSDLNRQFRNLGLSHTLAISGLHLGILLGSLSWLLGKLRLPRKAHLWVLLPITLFYMVLVGSHSVMRAGIMLLLLLFAHLFGRKRDLLTSLFVSVSIICLISPFSVLDTGLLLSFFSTFGILLLAPALTQRTKALPSLLRWLTDSLIVTASAMAFTLPFSIFYFGEASLISPLANLLFVPLITLLLYLIPLLLLCSPLPLLAAAPAYAIRLLSKLTFLLSGLLGDSDLFMLSLTSTPVQTVGLAVIALCIGLLIFRKTRPLALACTVLFWSYASGYLYIHTLNVSDEHTLFAYNEGENDALLLREGTRVMLCDASNGGYAFLSQAIAYAECDPAVRVDSLLLTHYHSRMLATLTRLLEDNSIEFLLLPSPDEAHADLAATLEIRAERAGCRVRYYSKEQCVIVYHGYTLLIDTDAEGTHPLNALTVQYGDETVLCYVADGEAGTAVGLPLLPACHEADLPPDPSLWNRAYE